MYFQVELIERGSLPDTRVDLRARTLIREDSDNEAENESSFLNRKTGQRMGSVSRTVLNDTYASIVRLACIEHDLAVKDPSARPSRGGHHHKRRGRGRAGRQGPPRFGPGDDDVVMAGMGAGRPIGGGMMSMEGHESNSSDDNEEEYDDDEEGDALMADAAAMNPEDMY